MFACSQHIINAIILFYTEKRGGKWAMVDDCDGRSNQVEIYYIKTFIIIDGECLNLVLYLYLYIYNARIAQSTLMLAEQERGIYVYTYALLYRTI